MDLKDTVSLMNDECNYNNRFRAEYMQLDIRMNKLKNMLIKYKNKELDFTPNCSYDLLNGQLKAMELYMSYLTERAIIENIEL